MNAPHTSLEDVRSKAASIGAARIVRCIKSDMDGDLDAGARYCDRIAANARNNPWADPAHAGNYAEAARLLRAELAGRTASQVGKEPSQFISDGFGNEWETPCPACEQPLQIVRPGKVQCGCDERVTL